MMLFGRSSPKRKGNANNFFALAQEAGRSGESKMKKLFEERVRQRNSMVRAQEFEHELGRLTHLASEKKAAAEARKKLEEIIGLELNKNLSRILSSFLINALGHSAVDALHAQGQLKAFLLKSGALKETILSLKRGERIQKNQFNAAALELRQMLEQMQE